MGVVAKVAMGVTVVVVMEEEPEEGGWEST